ncbi:MAG: prepilin-type N-terminal cleavage/methylation domain-containing protein [Candidatus Dadabacteria bacterium]|nr:prepilin-type N-terminal cleavage/methylation domain-containing protein [Candidatus Dadabacteria bacterium]MYE61342.1 prepilin-type N-terminal cleavage/methylation domain-containing protein [Candidatus Dadabacteria bacterium]MYI73288.1 prepilin-type N-terminal cleavage/methylation domain-containing protein [Candidatus Dadabacteria bacterium]
MKSASSIRDDKSGFTLIEVLIVVAITVIVLTMLYSSFSQLITVKRRVETENELIQEANTILLKMRHDLVNAFPRGNINSGVSSPSAYSYFTGRLEGDNSRIVFTSFAKDPTHYSTQSGQSEISYYLVPLRGEREDMFALMRKDNYWIGNDEAGAAYPISERVLSFRVNFLSERSPASADEQEVWEWNSSVMRGFPKAVQVQIILLGAGDQEEAYSMIVAIPVAD